MKTSDYSAFTKTRAKLLFHLKCYRWTELLPFTRNIIWKMKLPLWQGRNVKYSRSRLWWHIKTPNKLYLLCYCALILLVSEARTLQQRNSSVYSTCGSWSCWMATFLPRQPMEYRRRKLESSNSNTTGINSHLIGCCSVENFRAFLSANQIKLLRSQWIQTFLFSSVRRSFVRSFVRSFACLFGWNLACASCRVDRKSGFC